MFAAAVAQSTLQRGAASCERRHARRVRKRLAPQAAPHRLPPEEPRVQAVVAQRALRVCRCPTSRVPHQSRGAHSHSYAISASRDAGVVHAVPHRRDAAKGSSVREAKKGTSVLEGEGSLARTVREV